MLAARAATSRLARVGRGVTGGEVSRDQLAALFAEEMVLEYALQRHRRARVDGVL
jgi:hypothetical protein